MADGPGQAQSYGSGMPLNSLEQQMAAVLAAGGFVGGLSPIPTGNTGQVYMAGFRVPLDPALARVPGAKEAYNKGNLTTLDQAETLINDMTTEELQAWNQEVSRLYDYNVGKKNPKGLIDTWRSILPEYANYQKSTNDYETDVITYLKRFNDRRQAAGFGRPFEAIAGEGAGGGYRGPVTTYSKDTVIDITNPSQAKLLLDDALQNYLGRDATAEERQTFMDSLNKMQREEPQVVKSTSKTGAPGRPTQTQSRVTEQRAGVDPRAVAQEFARSRDEAAERRMGGQYMDWFMEKLMARPVTEMVSSGLQ